MTPYRERREQGYYSSTGEAPKSTTTDSLAGLGAPQKAAKEKQSSAPVKKRSRSRG